MKKLLEDIEILQTKFAMVRIIFKISVLLKIARILKFILWSIIDFFKYFFKSI